MFCPVCGNDAGNNNVCPYCNTDLSIINNQFIQNQQPQYPQQNQYAPQGQQNYYNQQPQYAPQNQYPQQGYGEQEQYGYQNQNPGYNTQYQQYPQQGYDPQVPQKKKKNIRIPIIIAAVIIVIAGIVGAVFAITYSNSKAEDKSDSESADADEKSGVSGSSGTGKVYFNKSSYSDDADRVVSITEDAFSLIDEDLDENDGRNTGEILIQALELMDNGYDKENTDAMVKSLTGSNGWENITDTVKQVTDVYDFKFTAGETVTWDELRESIGDSYDLDEDATINDFFKLIFNYSDTYGSSDAADSTADSLLESTESLGWNLTEDEVRTFAEADYDSFMGFADAYIEDFIAYEINVEFVADDPDNSHTATWVAYAFKIGGKWVCPSWYYGTMMTAGIKYLSSSNDAVVANAAENLLEYVKTEYATGDISGEGTIDIYASGGKLCYDFSGDVSQNKDYLLSYSDTSDNVNSSTRYRITIVDNNGTPSITMNKVD